MWWYRPHEEGLSEDGCNPKLQMCQVRQAGTHRKVLSGRRYGRTLSDDDEEVGQDVAKVRLWKEGCKQQVGAHTEGT